LFKYKYISFYIIILHFFINCKLGEGQTNLKSPDNINATIENDSIINIDKKKNDFQKCIESIPNYSKIKLEKSIRNYTKEDDSGYFIKKDSLNIYDKCVHSFFNSNKTEHDNGNFFYNITEKKYYPFFKQVKDDYITIGSFVQYYGENDIPGVSFQLNIFNHDGEQIDYLIVYNRFSFELVLKYDFIFNDKLSEIIIDKIEENWLFLDEEGEIIGERDTPKVKKEKETYKISSSGFIK